MPRPSPINETPISSKNDSARTFSVVHGFTVIDRRRENDAPVVEMHKLEIEHLRDDHANDGAIYRVEVRPTPRPKRFFEARITLSSKVMAESNAKIAEKIRHWFFKHPFATER
jgi:hypothetical protein